MKKYMYSSFICLLIITSGCADYPLVKFEEVISTWTVDLSNRVGKSFSIIRDSVVVEYTLLYDKETDVNYLIKNNTDTVFEGTVSKRRELYLLNRKLEDGGYAIHALKFTDSTVTGLETEWEQASIIEDAVNNGYYVGLVTDTTNSITMRVGKKAGKDIFRMVIEKLVPEKLLQTDVVPDAESFELKNSESEVEKGADKQKIITTIYPNPVIDMVNIELSESSNYTFQLYNSQGKLVKSEKHTTAKGNLDLSDIETGQYVLKVTNSNGEKDELQLIKM